MDVKKLFFGSFVMAMLFSSCNHEEEFLEKGENVARFSSSIEHVITTRVASDWEGTEKVGMYMVGESDFVAVSGVLNKQYNVAKGGSLTAVDGVEAVYPEDDSKVKFVAYYPYSSSIDQNIYKLNLAADGDNDLLYVKTLDVYDKSQSAAVPLVFAHQLAKLKLNIKKDAKDAEGVAANIVRSTTADFDLSTGILSNHDNSSTLAMNVSVAQATALVLPGKENNSKIVFTLEGKNYTWDVSTIDFAKGTEYTYTINLNENGNTDVVASLTTQIKGWAIEDGGEQNVSEDESETPEQTVSYAVPSVVGSFLQNTVISDAKLLVNYTNGDGSQVSVSTVVSGAASAGISVDNQEFTLSEGTGSFELGITGTPTASGEIIFTVSIGSVSLEGVTATVSAEEVTPSAPVYASNITLSTSDNSTDKYYTFNVTVGSESYSALKLGKSGDGGTWTSASLPASSTTLDFYAESWSDKTPELTVTINGGGTFSDGTTTKTETPKSNSAFSGTNKNPDISDTISESTLYSYTLKDITAATTLTFSTNNERSILWGVNVY